MAGKLNADMLVTAGLIKVSDSLEIILNLVDVTPSERNIFTKKYEANLQNILQFYSSAINDIAKTLRVKITKQLENRINQTREINPESM